MLMTNSISGFSRSPSSRGNQIDIQDTVVDPVLSPDAGDGGVEIAAAMAVEKVH